MTWPRGVTVLLGAALALAHLAATPAWAAGVAALSPLDSEATDPAVRRVVEGATIFRELAPVRFIGRREHEEFLLDRLPLAAALARRLYPALEPYTITETGPEQYEVDDRGALRGHLRLMAKAPGRRVYLAEGQFRSLAQLLRLNGAMVIALQYREAGDPDGAILVNAPHLYVRLENVLAHGLFKLLSPLIHGIIDRRFENLAGAAEVVSRRITGDPSGIYREMKGWPDVTDAQRAEFRRHFGLTEE